MNNWIKAMNPLSTAATEADARRAARASAIAIFIGVLYGVCSLVVGMDAMKAGIETQAAAQSPGMAGTMFQIALGLAAALIVVQLVLGFVQWAKPNSVIPIIFVILVAYGLISVPLGPMMAENMGVETPPVATWQMTTGLIVMVVELILHIAGIRGASALKRFRDAQAY